jgi:branched-chain amino acid transport system ATP-binding protein
MAAMTAASTTAAGSAPAQILRVDHISRRFGGLLAVDDVSFDVAAGEIVGLIGPNGAGKTTVFDIVSGHIAPHSGKVILDGRDVTNMPAARCARAGIGRTFQLVKPLSSLTVHENVMVGALFHYRTAEARERAAQIVHRVGMADLMDQSAHSLTLESRKRLELARALSINPRVLLLDEILAGLNATEVNDSLELISEFARTDGLGVIMIEHILHAVMSLADNVVVLDYGRKIAEGKPDEVVRHPKVVSAYLGSDD